MPVQNLLRFFFIFLSISYITGLVPELQAANRKNIPDPSKNNSYIGMVRKIRSFVVDGSLVRYIGSEGKFLVTADIEKYQNEHQPFKSGRKSLVEDLKNSQMNFISTYRKDHYLIFNGSENEVYFYSPQNQLISKHTIPYDLIRPARDRGGEAPDWEIADLRSQFKKNFSQRGLDKFTGIAPVPKKWLNSAKDLYFVASRIRDFPILMLACNPDNPSQCSFHRACVVEGARFNNALIAGIATIEKSRLLLLGREDSHAIDVFRFHSCMHITKITTLGLSKKLKKLSNIFVDDKQRLWLSTLQADDYFNASIFSWSKDSWITLIR